MNQRRYLASAIFDSLGLSHGVTMVTQLQYTVKLQETFHNVWLSKAILLYTRSHQGLHTAWPSEWSYHHDGPMNTSGGTGLSGHGSTPLPSQDNTENKKFWEELIAHLLLIQHGPHRKRRIQQFFVAAGTCLQSRCLATTGGYTDIYRLSFDMTRTAQKTTRPTILLLDSNGF
jgi:hypothetical protein